MGEIDFSVVSGVSGYVPPHNPYEGSFSNPISRWNTPPIIQFEPYKKLQYSSDDKKAHIRYEDDEGDHLHYENFYGCGFRFTFYISGALTPEELYRIGPRLKFLGNGFNRAVRKLLYGTHIMRLCPNCNSEISAELQECPHCGKKTGLAIHGFL